MKADVISLLAGTWSLLNTSATSNGTSIADPAFGSAPRGIVQYSASGFVSATLNSMDAADRPATLTFPFEDTDPDSAWALIGEHTLAYAGPFHISDAVPATNESGQVIHGPLISSTIPSFVGGNQVRNYSFAENFTLLNLQSTAEGRGGLQYSLWWTRLA